MDNYIDKIGLKFLFNSLKTLLNKIKLKISVLTDTETEYKLEIETNEEIIHTPNLKGESAYSVAVRNGFEGTEQEWLNSITTIVEGENILNRSVIGVYGNIKNRAFSVNVLTQLSLEPVGGETSMVEDDTIIIPKDAIYDININNIAGTGGNSAITIMLSLTSTYGNKIFTQYLPIGNTYVPIISLTQFFHAGDILKISLVFTIAQPGINHLGVPMFYVTQKTSISLNTWDLYEQWKAQDPLREDITFDEWISSQLRQSTVRCNGTIKNIALAANTWTEIAPIVISGDNSMINSNKYVAPISGLYMLSVRGLCGNTSSSNYLKIFDKNNINICYAKHDATSTFPLISMVKWLNKGEYLISAALSSVTQTYINNSADFSAEFEFALVGNNLSENLKPEDLERISTLEEAIIGIEASQLETLNILGV